MQNRLKEMVRSGQVVVGAFLGTNDPRLVELCGHAGFDYVLFDAEAYPYSAGDVENLVRAAAAGAGLPTLVRVPFNRPEIIRGYLDVGALGVMVPLVHNREEAEAAVAAAKYSPEGKRGWVLPRVSGGAGLNAREWAETSNRETMVIIQIEHQEAVENLAEIMEVNGVDAFELGQADLAQSLGLPGQVNDPLVREYVDRIVASVLSAGRVLGDTTDDPSEAAVLIDRGYRMIACNLYRLALSAGRHFVADVRASGGVDGGASTEGRTAPRKPGTLPPASRDLQGDPPVGRRSAQPPHRRPNGSRGEDQ